MSLKHRTFTAVRWTATGAVFSALLRVLQVAVLARMLQPEDFGLLAMVTVVLSMATAFSDLGLNSAYLQRRDVTPEQRTSLYWAHLMMSAVLAGLCIVFSPLIAEFFGDSRLVPILILSSSTFVFSALGQQLRITAQKELRFGRLVSLEVLSGLTGFFVAVYLAFQGFGVYALVWGSIISALVSSVLSWVFLAQGWRPRWQFRPGEVKPFMGFGGAVVLSGLVSQLNLVIDLLLGGRMLGASQLGLYSVPRNFMVQVQFLVNPIITRVGFPLIAEVQHDIGRVRNIYLKTLNMTASTNAPIYIGMAFFAPEVVEVLLGSDWSDVVELFRTLAIWGLVRSTINPVGSLLLGMGRASLMLKWGLVILLFTPPVLWFGSTFGVYGLAWSLLIFHVLVYIPVWAVLVRPLCEAKFGEYLAASSKSTLIALAAITPSYLLWSSVDDSHTKLILAASTSVALYVVLSYLFNRDWFVSMIQITRRVNPV